MKSSGKMRHGAAWRFLVSMMFVTSAVRGQVDWDCAPVCKCIWVSGKKTAECKRQDLAEIPSELSSEIQHLDLTGNRISHLESNAFNNIKIVNLQKLMLRDNMIKSIHVHAFNNLKIVIEIDLSGNMLRSLQPNTFNDTQRLRVLLLNNNRIEHLENHLFRDMAFLQRVELSGNRIETIGEQAFYNLSGLQTLTLDGNSLTSLKVQVFEQLPKLGGLELRKNPWDCNCHLKRFRDWVMAKKLYTRPTSCMHPSSLSGKLWDEVTSDEFACRPKIITIGPAQYTEVGPGDAYLWCRAAGIPRPQITWIHRSRIISNGTKRHHSDKGYLVLESTDWSNLTIPEVGMSDKGDYICVAKSYGGIMEKNISLIVVGESGSRESFVGLPLAIALGVIAFFFLLVALTMCFYYCRRHKGHHDEKSAEAASLDHHGLGEQEKSLITAINPIVKPPRRYEAPSVTSHGTEMTELNRTLLDSDSVFAEGVGSVVGVIANGLSEDDRIRVGTPEYDGMVSSMHGTLPRGMSYRQYPPDLLAFSAARNSSPTSQASTLADNSRLPLQFGPYGSGPSSPSGYHAFKTLPHPVRSSSATPYSMANLHPSMPRHGFVTIPRRPRAPSWSAAPPLSPVDRSIEPLEPLYDNLGVRKTADGSSKLSLNKSPEPPISMRNRPLPSTPGSTSSGSPSSNQGLAQLRARANITPTPTQPANNSNNSNSNNGPTDRANPEGAAELTQKSTNESAVSDKPQNGSTRKIPPRPPPKPKKKNLNGPLYEDEGEDGTEV